MNWTAYIFEACVILESLTSDLAVIKVMLGSFFTPVIVVWDLYNQLNCGHITELDIGQLTRLKMVTWTSNGPNKKIDLPDISIWYFGKK